MNILCLDIGSGTQDVLLYSPEKELENCPKFILPSPAVLVAQRITSLSDKGCDIYLYGHNMGGGFAGVLYTHLKQGLKVAAHPEAALALSDNLDKVRSKGIQISSSPPDGYVPVCLSDFDPGFWQTFLAQVNLSYPELILAAVQDHGYHPEESNRKGRFKIWQHLLQESEGRVKDFLFTKPPKSLTRLQTLQNKTGGCPVADTGAAAALGALFVPEVEKRSQREGICVVNVGNSHTIAFLIYQAKIWGIYEHHTGLLSPEKLWNDLYFFRQGKLSNEEVFEDQGHGCYTRQFPSSAGEFSPTYLLGPRRSKLQGFDVEFLAPGGDMMLVGCFGLLKGWEYKQVSKKG